MPESGFSCHVMLCNRRAMCLGGRPAKTSQPTWQQLVWPCTKRRQLGFQFPVMSHQLSASRWSHPSRHSSPAPASTRCSPVPPPSDAERTSSGPTSTYHRPLHINSVTGCLPAPPLLNVQHIYATQQSAFIHQLEHSTYQSFLIPQLPAPLAQVPLKQESCSSAAIIPFPDPTIINPVQSLRNSPPLHTVQPSITIHPPEDSTHQNILNRQEPLYLPHGQASTFQTVSYLLEYETFLDNVVPAITLYSSSEPRHVQWISRFGFLG